MERRRRGRVLHPNRPLGNESDSDDDDDDNNDDSNDDDEDDYEDGTEWR